MRFQDFKRNDKRGWRNAGGVIVPLALMTAAPHIGGGQSIPSHSAELLVSGHRSADLSALAAPVHILGRFRDPHTGICWRLLSNPGAPAGPAQLVVAKSSEDSCVPYVRAQAEQVAPGFAIHRGDRVVVEEHTRAVDARLEAAAMGSAMVGSSLDLKLRIGGRVVRALAIAPGRAVLMPATEGMR